MALNQSSDAAWLGLDLGTQSVRAMVVSESGETLAVGSHKLTSRRDGRRHEQDPGEWWRAISTACRATLTALGVPVEILPEVVRAGTCLGLVSAEAATQTGIPRGTSVIACFDYLDMLGAPVGGPFLLTGGGAKSRYWCQLRADVPLVAQHAQGRAAA